MKKAVFWDVAPCSLVDITLIMEAIISSETSISVYQTTWQTRRQPSSNVIFVQDIPSVNLK
jgi:hypothetical protein